MPMPGAVQTAIRPVPGNKAYGAVTLVLLGAAIALVFVPWADFVVVRVRPAPFPANMGRVIHSYEKLDLIRLKVSPVSFLVKMGKITDALGRRESSSSGQDEEDADGRKASRRSSETGADGGGGALLAACPFVYGVGLIVGIVGAFQIFARWRSVPATFGFVICGIACLLAIVGWTVFGTPGAAGRGKQAAVGVASLALTPWLYAALLTGVVGMFTSVLAITRRPR